MCHGCVSRAIAGVTSTASATAQRRTYARTGDTSVAHESRRPRPGHPAPLRSYHHLDMNQAIQITEFDADYTRWIGSASRCRANLQATAGARSVLRSAQPPVMMMHVDFRCGTWLT